MVCAFMDAVQLWIWICSIGYKDKGTSKIGTTCSKRGSKPASNQQPASKQASKRVLSTMIVIHSKRRLDRPEGYNPKKRYPNGTVTGTCWLLVRGPDEKPDVGTLRSIRVNGRASSNLVPERVNRQSTFELFDKL
ncbi:hypothetical protein M0802_004337 [Mischocyttarus mexicanus]|nr:hypothetical protein M0802_004337 [Mischocyttarus mexicanus]